MAEPALYPKSPRNIPADLTKASSSYKKQAWLALLGLMFFMLFYIGLAAGFAYITVSGVFSIQAGGATLPQMVITGSSLLLTIFMVKSLFSVRKAGDPGGLEVTEKDEPELYNFLHTLADEIGAPRPHRVFITPEVNAAVFYDLSLLNLIFPSKKNLIVGLGLVNVLNLGELKAVLAHEFGHFAQGSMVVGRWVYIAQQIIGHMVATRDWLDSLVKFVSRIDLRIAWLGWLLSLIIWSIRSLMDTLFRLVLMAERALSREMEFNADLVAVSVTGSDALVNALHKLQAADSSWRTALDVAGSEANGGRVLQDLFETQKAAMAKVSFILDEPDYGKTPELPSGVSEEEHRVFKQESAQPPQMWATHPPNSDRESNAKEVYIKADIDQRSAWEVFNDAEKLRQAITSGFYNSEKSAEQVVASPIDAVDRQFDRPSYAPKYRGMYLNRSPVRNFKSVDEMLNEGSVEADAQASIAKLYPASLATDLEAARSLDAEKYTLEALASGDLKPSGGVIRHRGEELKQSDIPDAIDEVMAERQEVGQRLKEQDASCRRAYLKAAGELGKGWDKYLVSLIALLHCTEHLKAKVENENALFRNTWAVITADGQIGHFEKKRMLKVCGNLQELMREISHSMAQIRLPTTIAESAGISNWSEQCPRFNLEDVTKKNWGQWCPAAADIIGQLYGALDILQRVALEELISTEERLGKALMEGAEIQDAPQPGAVPNSYHTLMPGDEHVLQRKLDLWNRFQLAHGFTPTLARLLVSIGIVGGTLYGGVLGIIT